MFRILSGILTIGNIEFSSDDEGFTRQNFDEDKAKNNLMIVSVCDDNNNHNICQYIFYIYLEYVWCQF